MATVPTMSATTYAALRPLAEARLETLRLEQEELVKFLNGSAAPTFAAADPVRSDDKPFPLWETKEGRKLLASTPEGRQTLASVRVKLRQMSDAARKKVGARMRKYWAERRREK